MAAGRDNADGSCGREMTCARSRALAHDEPIACEEAWQRAASPNLFHERAPEWRATTGPAAWSARLPHATGRGGVRLEASARVLWRLVT